MQSKEKLLTNYLKVLTFLNASKLQAIFLHSTKILKEWHGQWEHGVGKYPIAKSTLFKGMSKTWRSLIWSNKGLSMKKEKSRHWPTYNFRWPKFKWETTSVVIIKMLSTFLWKILEKAKFTSYKVLLQSREINVFKLENKIKQLVNFTRKNIQVQFDQA